MNEIMLGLQLMAIGITGVFIVLTVFYLIIKLLTKWGSKG